MKVRTMVLLFLIPVIAFTVNTSVAYSQSGDLYRIETTDGNVFIGQIISEDDNEIVIRTESIGTVTIHRNNIRSITLIDQSRIRDGVYWYSNPQATRYFFAPNAIGLEKRKGYYQNTWVFFNNVNYGVSDNFSVGGGIVPLFLFGASSTPVWILPKVSFPIAKDKLHLGAGAMIGGVIGAESDPLGIFYGVGTIGNRDKNLSVAIGYGYAGNEVSSTPLINVSGMIRVSRRVYLLSENYFIPEAGLTGIGSLGARWTSENFAVDFGLFSPLEDFDSLIGVPWLGVTIPFGR
ncbi:MAG: hypothetical protein JJU37_06910 [Balneolaceae bacterium]|nr:hypothetical protein [Balneolaceae bacterium]